MKTTNTLKHITQPHTYTHTQTHTIAKTFKTEFRIPKKPYCLLNDILQCGCCCCSFVRHCCFFCTFPLYSKSLQKLKKNRMSFIALLNTSFMRHPLFVAKEEDIHSFHMLISPLVRMSYNFFYYFVFFLYTDFFMSLFVSLCARAVLWCFIECVNQLNSVTSCVHFSVFFHFIFLR